MPDVAGHQGGAIRLDQVAAAEAAEAGQDVAHEAGYRGLTGAGVAEEHGMQAGGRGAMAELGAFAFGGEHVDEAAHLALTAARPTMLSSSAMA